MEHPKNNTLIIILLFIIIVLLGYMVFSKNKPIVIDNDIERMENITPVVDDKKNENQKVIPKETIKPATYDLSFFKKDLQMFPDSTISQCLVNGETYFRIVADKVSPEGSHLIGSFPEYYSVKGNNIGSCPYSIPPSERSEFCLSAEKSESSQTCKVVFQSDKSFGGKSIDTYNIIP